MKRLHSPLLLLGRTVSTQVNENSHQVSSPLNFLHGRRTDSQGSSKFDLIAPATGRQLRTVVHSNEEDVKDAVCIARNSFRAWSRVPGFERGQVLKKAASIVRAKCEELAFTEVLDTGKPVWEARFDILGCADTLDYYGGLAANITGDFLQLSGGSFAYTVREPLGVVGGIGAWNYPFQMAVYKSSPALACGNTVVFKPSELTPLTAVMLAEIYQEAGLPDGCYNVLQGAGETGQLLTSHPGVDKVSFTGSVPTGTKILSACAKDVKRVSVELGGKSPLIIFADAHLENAVKGAMLANFCNQGQVCSNGTRVYVEESILKQFLSMLTARVAKMKIGDPTLEDTAIGATISERQANIVLDYIELGKKEGAHVEYGGERVRPDNVQLVGGYYMRPCILTQCEDSMRVVREEIFGPVMSVLSFKSEDEVVRRANDSELGLAAGVFTRDLQRAHRVVSHLEAGSIYVNNYNVMSVGLPFGGYKKSGFGRENGADTINDYSQLKAVYMEGGDVDCPY